MEEKKIDSKGTLKISNEVVMKIAEIAASEVKGVANKEQKLYFGEHPHLGGKHRPVKVNMTREAAEIDVSVMVLKGNKTTIVAEEVQKAVKSAVQSMTGIVVAKVNVGIADIDLRENPNEDDKKNDKK